MPVSSAALIEIGTRFIATMNARDYHAAAELYAADAIYESSALSRNVEGSCRLVGRERILEYFKDSLDGDESFKLSPIDTFAGHNMALIVSSGEGRTFIDILRTNDDGEVVEHLEVDPKASPISLSRSGDLT